MKNKSRLNPFILSLGLFCFLSLSPQVMASEIDSFTRRYEPLADSSEIINQKANDMLSEAIVKANATSSCDEKSLYKEIREDFNIILNEGKLVNYIVQSPEVPRHQLERKDSIFKYHRIWDGYLLARPAADKDGIGIGMTMNFNGMYIGSDKFEHMFGQGYHYFRRYYEKGMSLKRVLVIGLWNERLHLGGNALATGVFTFADLVANFQGMRFWNHLLQKNEDLLGENLGPYISCENEKWKLVKKVDFKDYVDDGFDEAINCSAIVTKKGLAGVKKSLQELSEKHPEHSFTCPLDPNKLEQVKSKYTLPIGKRTLEYYLFNPWDRIQEYEIRMTW